MGLFASRPEEPTDWAGLPSEPLEPSGAETLAEVSATATSLSLFSVDAFESLPVPVPSTQALADTDEADSLQA